ncbi:phosphotransferase [Devosia crocina]|uniref:phosphotransferase n=1 Tax=Devosia crocina TaxID=429728 RepID=UPI003CC7AE33
MCHKDHISANLLTQDQRLAGVLDNGSLGPADPAPDLVAAWYLFETNERGGYELNLRAITRSGGAVRRGPFSRPWAWSGTTRTPSPG